MFFCLKIVVSALIIALVSEIAKRNSMIAAILASLPLLSILSIFWLYGETKNVQKVVELSNGIFWALLPSLFFFLAFPLLLKWKVPFYSALALSCFLMFVAYSIYIKLLQKFTL